MILWYAMFNQIQMFKIQLKIQDHEVSAIIDTAAEVTLISDRVYEKIIFFWRNHKTCKDEYCSQRYKDGRVSGGTNQNYNRDARVL